MTAFSETYTEARTKFLAAARSAGAEVASHRHDTQVGAEGEDLFLDVAYLGSREAEKAVVVGSGTHGIEGFVGSAAQTHWLSRLSRDKLPANVAVIFTHAHNPWGFSHALRFTEEHVDLNRNFIDFNHPPPENPNYKSVHELIVRPRWDDENLRRIFDGLSELREHLGEQAYSDAFNGGQYSHPDGIYFGGQREQWSNQAFTRAIREHLSGKKQAALIDFHSGIGPRGGHVFLCFHPQNSSAYRRVQTWWGERGVNRDGVTHKAVAKYQGLLVDAFVRLLPHTETTAVVVEFGTLPREQMQYAALAGRWLHTSQTIDTALRSRLMDEIREAFYPSSYEWRRGALQQAKTIIDAAISGIAA